MFLFTLYKEFIEIYIDFLCYSLYVNNWHRGMELLEFGFNNNTAIQIPPCSLKLFDLEFTNQDEGKSIAIIGSNSLKYLHKQSMNVCSFPRTTRKFILDHFLCNITYETHSVKWKLIFSCSALHNSSQKRLRVEKSRNPNRNWKNKISSPGLKLIYSQKQICIPR